ncbi:MAG: nitrogen fixation protein NifZ [Terracidiphilus sp.]|jgi:nitrogen fixation protein NifZ
MMEASVPRYEWGQRVQAAADLLNDGSYPGQPSDALLVQGGEAGEVVQIGRHTDSGTVVYMVEFALNRIVGCFEQELEPWQSNGGAQ